jgi:hypothetical protein
MLLSPESDDMPFFLLLFQALGRNQRHLAKAQLPLYRFSITIIKTDNYTDF